VISITMNMCDIELPCYQTQEILAKRDGRYINVWNCVAMTEWTQVSSVRKELIDVNLAICACLPRSIHPSNLSRMKQLNLHTFFLRFFSLHYWNGNVSCVTMESEATRGKCKCYNWIHCRVNKVELDERSLSWWNYYFVEVWISW